MKKPDSLTPAEFSLLKDFLVKKTGIVIGENRAIFFENRLYKYIVKNNIGSWFEFLELLKNMGMEELNRDIIPFLTTNKTSFFREKEHFDYIQESIVPSLNSRDEIYAWCAAVSTGEEAYSLSVVLHDAIEKKRSNQSIRILGSDINQEVLTKAAGGVYSKDKIEETGFKYGLKNYLYRGQVGTLVQYRFTEQIMDSIKYLNLNLLKTETYPRIKFDIIMLRNVLIYFDQKTIMKIVNSMSHHLNEGGVLILGLSEKLQEDVGGLTYIGRSMYAKKNQIIKRPIPENEKTVSVDPPREEEESIKSRSRKVLVVEDSKPMQKILGRIIDGDRELELVGIASDAETAKVMIEELKPDVITLDVQLPVMNGVDFLEKIVPNLAAEIAVVVVSSYGKDDFNYCFRALEAGAFDYIEKPSANKMTEAAGDLVNILKQARSTKLMKKKAIKGRRVETSSSLKSDKNLIVIGASTGGVLALKELFSDFPEQIPPVIVVQHIPKAFSGKFAKRLDELFSFRVVEVEDAMVVENNCVYIAPGGSQIKLRSQRGQYKLQVNSDPPMNGHQPSVDYFFNSVAECVQKPESTYGVLLTGMGKDGAKGLKKLSEVGCHTIAQDEKSSVVFGMPKAAIELNAADYIEPLDKISHLIFELMEKKGGKKCA